MNINERVEIELTRHDLDLVRYQNGQIKDAFSSISGLQAEIVSELKRAEPGSKRQLEQLLERVNEAIDRTYAAMALESIESLGEFAVAESQAVSNIGSGLPGADCPEDFTEKRCARDRRDDPGTE